MTVLQRVVVQEYNFLFKTSVQLSFVSAARNGEIKVREITHLSENLWKWQRF